MWLFERTTRSHLLPQKFQPLHFNDLKFLRPLLAKFLEPILVDALQLSQHPLPLQTRPKFLLFGLLLRHSELSEGGGLLELLLLGQLLGLGETLYLLGLGLGATVYQVVTETRMVGLVFLRGGGSGVVGCAGGMGRKGEPRPVFCPFLLAPSWLSMQSICSPWIFDLKSSSVAFPIVGSSKSLLAMYLLMSSKVMADSMKALGSDMVG